MVLFHSGATLHHDAKFVAVVASAHRKCYLYTRGGKPLGIEVRLSLSWIGDGCLRLLAAHQFGRSNMSANGLFSGLLIRSLSQKNID